MTIYVDCDVCGERFNQQAAASYLREIWLKDNKGRDEMIAVCNHHSAEDIRAAFPTHTPGADYGLL